MVQVQDVVAVMWVGKLLRNEVCRSKRQNIFPIMFSKISPKVLLSIKRYLCELAGVGVSGNIFRTEWELSDHLQEWAGVLKVFARVDECGQSICRSG